MKINFERKQSNQSNNSRRDVDPIFAREVISDLVSKFSGIGYDVMKTSDSALVCLEPERFKLKIYQTIRDTARGEILYALTDAKPNPRRVLEILSGDGYQSELASFS